MHSELRIICFICIFAKNFKGFAERRNVSMIRRAVECKKQKTKLLTFTDSGKYYSARNVGIFLAMAYYIAKY